VIQKALFRRSLVLVAAALVILAASGCGGGGVTASPSATTSAAPTSPFGASVGTYTPLRNSDNWVVWSKTNCKYEPASTHPTTYIVNLRKAPNMTLGHQIQSEDNAINLLKNSSVKAAADLTGMKYAGVNGRYPDQAAMVSAAENIVTQNPAAVIEDQPLATLAERLNGIYSAKCIPFVQLSLASPGAITFGASNADVGAAEGAALIAEVKKRSFAPPDITVVGSIIPSLGPINDRVTGCQAALQKEFPALKVDSLQLAAGTVADTQTTMTNWLTAHPQAKNVLGCVISGLQAVGMDNALTAAGRQTAAAIMTTGNTKVDLDALPKTTAIIGSVDFGNANFGFFAVGMAQSAIAGEPVPDFVYTPLTVIPKT
jgi:ABC-type sugar transport system substrate-binding protein